MPSTGLAAGILASVLLSFLTLSVFYVLQDFGPESAIRKYNQAILDGDYAMEARVSSQPIDSADGLRLHAFVLGLLRDGGRLRLWQLDRHVDQPPSYVVAYVDYVTPTGSVGFPIIVTYENHAWKVNESATVAAIQEREMQGRSPART